MRILIFISFITLALPVVKGQPDFSSGQWIEGVQVFADAKDRSSYYYSPGKLHLIKDAMGKPDFKFVQMRYTGTRATANQNLKKFNSLIKFQVGIDRCSSSLLDKIRKHLGSAQHEITLQLLPLQKIQAFLVYAAIEDSGKRTQPTTTLSGGFFGSADPDLELLWSQRSFTLRLSPANAQLFWNAFSRKQSILSVGYAYYAYGVAPGHKETIVQGEGKWLDELNQHFPTTLDSLERGTKITAQRIFSDAFDIQIDSRQYPDLLQQVDINEMLPPDYAALDVYCYDFNNDLRPDLYAKRIELKAIGVGRDAVISKITFRANSPDIYAYNVRFQHSVKLDMPLSYRITEIPRDGKIRVLPWQEKRSWHEILDLTSKENNKVN